MPAASSKRTSRSSSLAVRCGGSSSFIVRQTYSRQRRDSTVCSNQIRLIAFG
jgi:hypothetical protein